MAKQTINIGTNDNDGTGDKLRDALRKVNENFTELYASTSSNTNISLANNTVGITNINGNLYLEPNGTGKLIVETGATFNVGYQPTSAFEVKGSDQSTVFKVNPQFNNVGINTTANVEGLYVEGNIDLRGTQANIVANIDLGDATHHIHFQGKINSNIVPLSNLSYSLGSDTLRWNDIHVTNVNATLGNLSTASVSIGITSPNITVSNDFTVGNLLLRNNQIQNVDASEDIEITSSGTGRVYVDAKLRITGEIIQSNRTISAATGAAGDEPGMIASDDDYIYRCFGTYDGSTIIWKRAGLSTW